MTMQKVTLFLKRHRTALAMVAVAAVVLPALLIAVSYRAIDPYKQYIVPIDNARQADVGLVLGAGVTKDGKPFKELQARLDIGAEALHRGAVKKLILSGDNRFSHYDEPSAMMRYLIEQKGVPSDKLQLDFAGRSTYESCERAAKIFRLKKVMLISAPSHLPRAIYLCRHFGIEAYGIGSSVEANNSTRRELLARVKALYNVYLSGEPTLLGDPIPINIPN